MGQPQGLTHLRASAFATLLVLLSALLAACASAGVTPGSPSPRSEQPSVASATPSSLVASEPDDQPASAHAEPIAAALRHHPSDEL